MDDFNQINGLITTDGQVGCSDISGGKRHLSISRNMHEITSVFVLN